MPEQEEEGSSGDAEDDDDDFVLPLDEEAADAAAEVLGFDRGKLVRALKFRRVQVKGRDSFYEEKRSPADFRGTLQSLQKLLYKRLFDRVVEVLNQALGGGV